MQVYFSILQNLFLYYHSSPDFTRGNLRKNPQAYRKGPMKMQKNREQGESGLTAAAGCNKITAYG
jgi:hypothetical protein